MPLIDQTRVEQFFRLGMNGASTSEKGRAFEDLICYVFALIPGVSITRRNAMNVFNTEEIDVALWNERSASGIAFAQEIVLIECKNWSSPVGSAEVNWFDSKLRSRGLDFGILVATQGITGDAQDLTAAHSIIAAALRERRRLIVITKAELECLQDTDTLIHLMKEKLCDLAVSGSLV
jgi:hypothetical protein